MLRFEVLILFQKYSSISFHFSRLFVNVRFKIFKCLSLLVKLLFHLFFLGLNSSHLFLHVFLWLLSFKSQPFIITLNGVFKLPTELVNPLFLELELLRLQSLISFKFNFSLSKLIQSLLMLSSNLLNFITKISLLRVCFFS